MLADRLNRKEQALAYYTQFLDMFRRNPVDIEASIAGVRSRAQFLAAQL